VGERVAIGEKRRYTCVYGPDSSRSAVAEGSRLSSIDLCRLIGLRVKDGARYRILCHGPAVTLIVLFAAAVTDIHMDYHKSRGWLQL
jgi:hypothetical protein